MYTGRSQRGLGCNECQHSEGLGILPVIVTQAVNLLVPAVESLFKSNSTYSYPAAKAMIDNWAGVVNLDPTFQTAGAQWAWANIRCLAGDPAAAADVSAAAQLFPLKQLGPFSMRLTPDGPISSDFVNPCRATQADAVAYALAAVRVLTTAKASNPMTDTLYGGTPPPPLPRIVPQPPPSQPPPSNQLFGIPIEYLALGAAGVAALIFGGGRR